MRAVHSKDSIFVTIQCTTGLIFYNDSKCLKSSLSVEIMQLEKMRPSKMGQSVRPKTEVLISNKN